MTVARVDFYTVYRRLAALLGAVPSSSFTAVLDDPRRSPGELFTSIQAADDETCTLIGEGEGGQFRPLFLTDTSDLSHGDTLPDRLGPMTQVKIKYLSTDMDYKAGKFDKGLSLADLERWRIDAGNIYGAKHDVANSSLSGYYIQLGDEIYFTGYRAKGKIAVYARLSRDVTDGAMTSATKTLTSATAAFTSADAGGCALVDGAGLLGVSLVSRIDAYTNGTTVVLRDANVSGGNITGKTVTIAKLQAPQNYEDALLAFAVTHQVKRGDNPPFASQWVSAANAYRGWIESGRVTLPTLEMAQAA